MATVLALTSGACGGPVSSASDRTGRRGGPFVGQPAASGALSPGEALDSDATGPLLVRGYVVVRDGHTRLCEALAQSHPPQCGGRSLTLEGYDAATMEGGEEDQGVRWSSSHVEVLVERREGAFVVVTTAR